ncbi:hydroxyacid dehydrogenase [Candidatus Endobugula sertula]|uniref:Hydroxyacid dehydrogenase n=1 Tax=Candidatus Endobugula sertula TaxID=62101 RepID=A0A1D2QSK2_9GAMM|nr:hydroxyacid dehydrogenase [Candidatus Endobugula sertula]
MRVLVYSANEYTKDMLLTANANNEHQFDFTETRLEAQTTILADQYPAVCCFVDDSLNGLVLQHLKNHGVKLVLLRCTGFNNVDLRAAQELGLRVMRVVSYSPHSVAEFTVGMILNLNRKIHRAYNRVREGNFLLDGLLGFDLFGKTVGIIGTGKIGTAFAHIIKGFGCHLLAYDVVTRSECEEIGVYYTDLSSLLNQSDIVSLHLPLTPDSFHMINQSTLSKMKKTALLINTSRGGIINTGDLVKALKQYHLAGVGLDVYEEESHLFYQDMRDQIIDDDTFSRLLTFPNVLLTGHQAFFTQEALQQIGKTTIDNLNDFIHQRDSKNSLKAEDIIVSSSKG